MGAGRWGGARGLAALAAGAACAALVLTAPTSALWRDGLPVAGEVVVGLGVAGFAVESADPRVRAVAPAGDSSADVKQVVLDGRSVAAALLAAPGRAIAIPIQVLSRADGNVGLSYSFGVDPASPPDPGGVLESTELFAWRPPSGGLCAPAPSSSLGGQGVPWDGSPPGSGVSGVVGVLDGKADEESAELWCLQLVLDPGYVFSPGSAGGVYANDAVATFAHQSGSAGRSRWGRYTSDLSGGFPWCLEVEAPGSPTDADVVVTISPELFR